MFNRIQITNIALLVDVGCVVVWFYLVLIQFVPVNNQRDKAFKITELLFSYIVI